MKLFYFSFFSFFSLKLYNFSEKERKRENDFSPKLYNFSEKEGERENDHIKQRFIFTDHFSLMTSSLFTLLSGKLVTPITAINFSI